MSLPDMKLAHMGITVKNLAVMEDFYKRVLGFKASDRGIARGTPLVFLTRAVGECAWPRFCRLLRGDTDLKRVLARRFGRKLRKRREG